MASRPPGNGSAPDDEARNRWIVLQAMRVMGVALVVLGILMSQDRIDMVGENNRLVGYFFIAIGLVDAFAMPLVLARKWRTPPE